MEGKWSDGPNLARVFDLAAQLRERGETALSASDREFLQEFFTDFAPDLKRFAEAVTVAMSDALNAVADALKCVSAAVARAQKDGLRQPNSPAAVRFQAPTLPAGRIGGISAVLRAPELSEEQLRSVVDRSLVSPQIARRRRY